MSNTNQMVRDGEAGNELIVIIWLFSLGRSAHEIFLSSAAPMSRFEAYRISRILSITEIIIPFDLFFMLIQLCNRFSSTRSLSCHSLTVCQRDHLLFSRALKDFLPVLSNIQSRAVTRNWKSPPRQSYSTAVALNNIYNPNQLAIMANSCNYDARYH